MYTNKLLQCAHDTPTWIAIADCDSESDWYPTGVTGNPIGIAVIAIRIAIQYRHACSPVPTHAANRHAANRAPRH